MHAYAKPHGPERVTVRSSAMGGTEVDRFDTLIGECDRGLYYGNTRCGLVDHHSVYLVSR